MLERGEKLNDLVDRSNALSAQSKMFYKTAKKVCALVGAPCMVLMSSILRPAKLVLFDHVMWTLDCDCVLYVSGIYLD